MEGYPGGEVNATAGRPAECPEGFCPQCFACGFEVPVNKHGTWLVKEGWRDVLKATSTHRGTKWKQDKFDIGMEDDQYVQGMWASRKPPARKDVELLRRWMRVAVDALKFVQTTHGKSRQGAPSEDAEEKGTDEGAQPPASAGIRAGGRGAAETPADTTEAETPEEESELKKPEPEVAPRDVEMHLQWLLQVESIFDRGIHEMVHQIGMQHSDQGQLLAEMWHLQAGVTGRFLQTAIPESRPTPSTLPGASWGAQPWSAS
ncbi:hypothetical protein CYMTET_46145 [Cymbomonas tetramitiformis]|uniref:Uncharacterized protein n=1 Tax=Cymbomonas tetramitiformis TaxID=36881 RepID=A0AAE0BY94_9CHLO|nr:hypothetical protein CYMTET_46145 [Cymbomonas tetramitiformis]